jgi:hypothetical protein
MEAARAELSKLQQERAALEAEINERSARLNAPGQPGMHESLIDKEVCPVPGPQDLLLLLYAPTPACF